MRILLCVFALFSYTSFAAGSPQIQKYLTTLLKANDAIHTAFIKNDEPGFKTALAGLDKVLGEARVDELKQFVTESKSASAKLVSAANFDEKRKLYGDVVKPIVAMLQKYGPIESYRVFTCPMVKKDWIQDTKIASKVQNPYEPKMVDCGMMRD